MHFFIHSLLTTFSKITDFTFFCIAFFLVRLPPFYILPSGSAIFNSHSIGRYLLLLLLLKTFSLYKNKLVLGKRLTIILLLYFIGQSLSIIYTNNIQEFLLIWKDIVFGLIIFLITLQVLGTKKRTEKIVFLLFITILINLAFQFIIYFFSQTFFLMIYPYLYSKYTYNLQIQFNRGRYFVDMFEAGLIPFIIYYFVKQKLIIKKLAFFFVSFSMIFFALVSSFRAQLVVILVSLFSSIFLIFRKVKTILVLIVFLALSYKIVTIISFPISSQNSLSRFFIEADSITSIRGRVFFWNKAVEMGLSSLLFGVGLGNFYDNLSNKQIITSSLFDPKNELMKVTAIHPHNIFFSAFAETGIIGLLSLIFMIIYFFISDLKSLQRTTSLNLLTIISFWSIFLFSLIQPDTILQYRVIFWFLRGLIIKTQKFSL